MRPVTLILRRLRIFSARPTTSVGAKPCLLTSPLAFTSSSTGTFSKGLPTNQITLIEVEALQGAKQDSGLEISAEESRRNVLTCGVALNHLVGREFCIGEVRLRGLKLCEPCSHLEKVTAKKVIAALRHRGGLRAEILVSGAIRVGDVIAETDSQNL